MATKKVKINLIRRLLSSNQPWKNIEEKATMKKGQNPAQVQTEASVDASPRRCSNRSFPIYLWLIDIKPFFLTETIGSGVEWLAVASHQSANDSDRLWNDGILLLRTSTKTSFRILQRWWTILKWPMMSYFSLPPKPSSRAIMIVIKGDELTSMFVYT